MMLNQILGVPSFAGIPTAPELCHSRPATDWENGTPQCPPMTPSTSAWFNWEALIFRARRCEYELIDLLHTAVHDRQSRPANLKIDTSR